MPSRPITQYTPTVHCSHPVLSVPPSLHRCCAFAPSSDDEQVVPRIYLGTQPADLIYSDDLGGSWSSSELSEAPQADNWFRRLPPYDPSVRSINFCGSRSTAQQATAAAAAGEPQTAPIDLLVAVEVGADATTTACCHAGAMCLHARRVCQILLQGWRVCLPVSSLVK